MYDVPEFVFVHSSEHNMNAAMSSRRGTQRTSEPLPITGVPDNEVLVDDDNLNTLTKQQLIIQCILRSKNVQKSAELLDNQELVVERLTKDVEMTREFAEELKRKLEDVNHSSGSSTIISRRTSIVSLVEVYSENQRSLLARAIRNDFFKKFKVTNKKSFESGEIQKLCHSVLGAEFVDPEMMCAYKDAFVKLVNYELGQKRSNVNTLLLKKWKGKNRSFFMRSVCYYACINTSVVVS
jgi:hypothetical protein